MGRIRSIKPEFPQSESIGRVSRDARLLFIQLWTVVDDEGRARGSSRMLASLLYPYDDDARTLIDAWMTELERESMVRRYEVEGQSYLEITNFKKHQKIDHPSPSKLPAFVEPSRTLASPREKERGIVEGKGEDQGGVASESSRLPEWLPIDAWNGWMEVRKKLKKNGRQVPWTDRCEKIALGKLEEWHKQGYSLTKILDAATMGNWQGLYLPKDDHGNEIKPQKVYRKGDPKNPADWAAAVIPFDEVIQ